jgi:hypothetical protein
MQRLMKLCARGALGLGAAALLQAGVPAHAGPASSESVLAPADASRESQPLRLAQSKTQPEEAEKPEQRALQEQQEQKKDKLQQEEKSGMQQPRKMRRMEKSAPAPREAVPAKPGTSRFGAGVIRDKESADGD